MKKKLIYFCVIAMAMMFVACDENQVLPSYKKVGTSTHTMADIRVSNTAPPVSEDVTITISYVNPSSDPLEGISIRAKVGDANYVEIQTFTSNTEEMNSEVTKSFVYTTPATAGTTVIFAMVITSQRDFPQIEQTQLVTE